MERFRKFNWPDGVDESVLRQKKVTCTIPVHGEHRRATHRNEGRTLINSVYRDTGCIIVAHWDQHVIKQFDVFAGPGSRNAIAAINKWIARGDERSKDASAWAKTPAFDQEQWDQEQLARMEDEQAEIYLGPVPDAQEGDPEWQKITINWPEDLLNDEIIPRTVFGSDLQAVNDIRKQEKVFIILQPNHSVEILGLNMLNIEAAELRYRSLLHRIRIEKCNLYQATNILLDEREGIDVTLLRAESWWPDHTDMIVPRLLPSSMMEQPGSFRDDVLSDQRLEQIRIAIQRSLEAVRHRKGYYDFAVHFGSVALDAEKMGQNYVGRTFGKEKFLKSINGTVDLRPKKWLFDNELGKQLYHSFVTADDILEPVKAGGSWGTLPSNLEDTYPSLRGTWIFRDPSDNRKPHLSASRNGARSMSIHQALSTAEVSTPIGLIVAQVDWTDDGDGCYDKTATRFYRLDPGKKNPKVNMDLNLLELGESRSWSFALESMTLIPQSTVHPTLTGFAQRTAIRKGYDIASTQSFAQWDPSPSVKALLLHGRLDKTYSFGVQETCYKVELTAMWYPRQSLPCWGLAVRHTEWATHLAELERLQTGHQASWSNVLETFFPNDGCTSVQPEDDTFGMGNLRIDDGPKVLQVPSAKGVSVLMDILLQLSKIVKSVTQREGVQT